MDLRDMELTMKPIAADGRHRSSIMTVDDDDDLEEAVTAVANAQLLAAKALELTQLQRTHDEYVKSSCEYERELETEVDRYEKKTQQLEQTTAQLEREKSELHASIGGSREELQVTQRREHMLQTQLQEMKWKIQRLEQANDDLETAARIAQATIEDLQHKAETLLEQNVFLQHEKEELQRQFSVSNLAAGGTTAGPGATAAGAPTRPSSFRFSRKSSSQLTPEAAVTLAQGNPQNGKKKGRYPEVLETCIHLTCRKCRANKPHSHNTGSRASEGGKASIGFFERLRLFLFGPER
ncbi:hypothetical protein BBJ28_00018215 [Nothophytophthora sp. Chile5]|nr:hypothetical protein BBJ28_00018215 [Nothophytophthora sp. Chile5]